MRTRNDLTVSVRTLLTLLMMIATTVVQAQDSL